MHPRLLLLLALLLSFPALAEEDTDEEEGSTAPTVEEEIQPAVKGDVKFKAFQGLGAMSGAGIIEEGGLISLTRLAVTPRIRAQGGRLAFPMTLTHRQSFGFPLTQLQAQLAVEPRYRRGILILQADLGAAFTWRPGWHDPYQPSANGNLATNRKSFWTPDLSGQVVLKPGPHRIELSYAFRKPDYINDPAFDATVNPNHLVPGDHIQHRVALKYRLDLGTLSPRAGVVIQHRSYSDQYARDAGTGKTHATSTKVQPNPFYSVRSVYPSLALVVNPEDSPLRLKVGYTLELVTDLFQGYYSYTGQKPEFSLSLDLPTKKAEQFVEIDVSVAASLRRYGPDSYAAGGSHPPLDFGDRRADRRFKAGLNLAIPLHRHWALALEADLLVRRTNFPNYEPGVYPSTAAFDIKWDYNDLLGVVGLRYE